MDIQVGKTYTFRSMKRDGMFQLGSEHNDHEVVVKNKNGPTSWLVNCLCGQVIPADVWVYPFELFPTVELEGVTYE